MRKIARGRQHLLAELINTHGLSIGAEIGVGTGPTTDALLSGNPTLEWIAVDYWPAGFPLRYGGNMTLERQVEVRAKFMRVMAKHGDRLRLIEKPSVEAAAEIGDGTLDLIFIDADHSYEGCLADIKAWSPKVRPGGFIAGHDYHHTDFPGVVQAVQECFPHFTLHPDDVWMVQA